MKKGFLVIMVFILAVTLGLAACSSSTATTTPPTSTSVAPTTTAAPATSAAPTTTAAPTSAAPTTAAPTTAKPTPTPTGGPLYGGTLTIINKVGPTIFGYPPESDPISASAGRNAIEGLLWVDQTGGPVARLATAWDIAADGKSITFTLRKGVKFHDGTDFDAAAVKWNIDTYLAAKPLSPVISVDVIDPSTVRFNLSQFSNVLFPTVAFTGLISPTAVQKNGKDWARTNPVGTGPFKFVSFQRDVSLNYVKFADYWDKGKPYLDGINYLFVADPVTASLAFQTGVSQMITQLAAKDGNDLKNKGFNVVYMPGTLGFLAPDSANPSSPFANKLVRQAVEYAINTKAVVDAIGYGFMQTANQLSPSQFPGYNPDITGRSYDPAKARQLLSDAGYPSGFKTTLTGQTTDNRDALIAIQSYLKAVGIDAALDIADSGRYLQLRTTGWKNGLILGGTGADPNQNQRLSGDLAANSGYYVSTLRPPAWQPALDASMGARDLQTRIPLMQALLKIAADEAMVTPLWINPDMGAEVSSVHADYLAFHHVQWKPAEAWLSK